ncbi:UNVERIFIED_CONTAM: hypothetical protein RMT77_008275 [Armadillidium vulgare]
MKNLKGLRIALILAISLSLTQSLPLQNSNEEIRASDSTVININGKFTPIIEESEDLSEFFDFLTEMRSKKSLSIVGKDSKYIYLLVSDEGEIKENNQDLEKIDIVEDPTSRERRSTVLKTLGRGLALIGPNSVRMIAIPISLFNFLGYLPVRLPGVPYHIDSGSPDNNPYDVVNHFYH